MKAALRASRHQEKRLREDLQRVQQENEALKKGQPSNESLELTDAELEDLKENFPTQYKVAVAARNLQQHLNSQRDMERTQGFEPPSYAPEVQEVIDTVPDLLAWQFDPKTQDRFARAIEYDKALIADPDWKGKPAAERFAEAARRTKTAFGDTPAPSPTPSAAPAANRTDPAKVIEQAPVEGPKGLSDFRGGGPANAPALDFNKMSDAEIMGALKPE